MTNYVYYDICLCFILSFIITRRVSFRHNIARPTKVLYIFGSRSGTRLETLFLSFSLFSNLFYF